MSGVPRQSGCMCAPQPFGRPHALFQNPQQCFGANVKGQRYVPIRPTPRNWMLPTRRGPKANLQYTKSKRTEFKSDFNPEMTVSQRPVGHLGDSKRGRQLSEQATQQVQRGNGNHYGKPNGLGGLSSCNATCGYIMLGLLWGLSIMLGLLLIK